MVVQCHPVTLADIHMIRMETDVVVPIGPIFYKRYVDDIYYRHQKNAVDKLYDGLNNYHLKVKPWNYNTNRNNMKENLLLYGRLSLQVVYC